MMILQLFPDMPLDERAVKARTFTLIGLYRKQDVRKGRRSGTEEQFGLIESLLADIEEAERNAEDLKKQKKIHKVNTQKQLQKARAYVKTVGEISKEQQGEKSDNEDIGECF